MSQELARAQGQEGNVSFKVRCFLSSLEMMMLWVGCGNCCSQAGQTWSATEPWGFSQPPLALPAPTEGHRHHRQAISIGAVEVLLRFPGHR